MGEAAFTSALWIAGAVLVVYCLDQVIDTIDKILSRRHDDR